jgi:hypothetical protein
MSQSNQALPPSIQPVLKKLNLSNSSLLGQGGEGFVFHYDNNRVVKVYPKTSRAYLEQLANFQTLLSRENLGYMTPEIEQIGFGKLQHPPSLSSDN